MLSKELYKSLTMEIRPRVQSVNVYINLLDPNSVSIRLNVDSFEVKIGSQKQVVDCKDFHINPKSLACFSNTNNQVTFRFATENVQKTSGSTCCELLTAQMQSCSISDTKTSTFLSEGVDYSISCSNCSRTFCKSVKFRRILPLPENLDTSDWFCHTYKDKFVLKPKDNEALYSQCFAFLHPTLLQGLASDNSVLTCNECNSWIGTVQKNAYKVWFNTVVFTCDSGKYVSCPLSDCLMVALIESTPLRSTRLVLKCSSNPCDEVLLLWILEPKLSVHFFGTDSNFKEDVAKVLFKCEDAGSDILSQWMSDLNVTTYDVSKAMMFKLREHLLEMSRYIPKDFNSSNGFCISYMKLSANK